MYGSLCINEQHNCTTSALKMYKLFALCIFDTSRAIALLGVDALFI
jgi:hypothetical protein